MFSVIIIESAEDKLQFWLGAKSIIFKAYCFERIYPMRNVFFKSSAKFENILTL